MRSDSSKFTQSKSNPIQTVRPLFYFNFSTSYLFAERIPSDTLLAITTSPKSFRAFLASHKQPINRYDTPKKTVNENSLKRKRSPNVVSPNHERQTSILDFFGSRAAKQRKMVAAVDLTTIELNVPDDPKPTQFDGFVAPICETTTLSDDCSSSTSSSVITNLSYLNAMLSKNKLKRMPVSTPGKTGETNTPEVVEEEYTVEKILQLNEIDNKPHFLVKWKGWGSNANTWEPLAHIQDCDPFKRFILAKHESYAAEVQAMASRLSENEESDKLVDDKEAFRRAVDFNEYQLQSDLLLLVMLKSDTEPAVIEVISKRAKSALSALPYVARRIEQLEDLHRFETTINAKDKSSNLTVENIVDFDGAPQRFEYINDVIPGEGVVIPDDPPVGCDCPDGCKYANAKCCGRNSGSAFAYNSKKRIRVSPGTPVFECNKRCKCGPECMNRVVQQGRKHSLCIFKTANGCGWGVRTLRTIWVGQFICEYVGEILTSDETERRGRIYDAEGQTYLFDLDMNSKDNPYTIDAAHYGNVSHFINHSCDPNCGVWAVWIDCLDLDLPKICLFALRRIDAGEELSFDYMNQKVTIGNVGRSLQHSAAIESKTLSTGDESFSKAETVVSNHSSNVPTYVVDSSNAQQTTKIEPSSTHQATVCRCNAANCRKYVF